MHERWRGATVYHISGQTYRMGASIGPHNYDQTGIWTPDASNQDLDVWQPIDLRPGLTAASGIQRRVHKSGMQSDWHHDGSITCERGGTSCTLRLLALAWINDAGERQVIGSFQPGPVVDDEDGLWRIDALGTGIDYGARLYPDMTRPVVRINNPSRLIL
ncbi:MAG TPA: hypothetical protein VKA04_10955, partial [Pseudodesulfovibrio sp.]|nr:hypothetical protein [Pseudodesulfovibrio sp.]